MLVGVPPGVGDSYWCLTKMKAFKRHYDIKHLTLAILKTSKDRAIEWRHMVDFVDDARYVNFSPGEAERTGFARDVRFLNFVMWPNAIVDKGIHLRDWLPELELDLDFEVRTQLVPDVAPGSVVLYASSKEVNRAWLPRARGDFWIQLALEIKARFGAPPVLIGAGWDDENSRLVAPHTQGLVGKTSLREVAWILKHAKAVVGIICGMTIVANHFRVPTVALSPDKFKPAFPYTWVDRQPWYKALRASEMGGPDNVAAVLEAMVREKEAVP